MPGMFFIIDWQQGHTIGLVCCVVWFMGVVVWLICCWVSFAEFVELEAVVGVTVWVWVFASVGLAVNVSNAKCATDPLNIILERVIMLIFYSLYLCGFTSSKRTKAIIKFLPK